MNNTFSAKITAIHISKIEKVGSMFTATATNGIDVFAASAKTAEIAERRAINGLSALFR